MKWAELKDFVASVYGASLEGTIGRNTGQAWTPRKLLIQPYTYPVVFNTVVHGATQNATLAIAANADFVLTSPRYRAFQADATRDVVPACTVLITDTGSNQQFSSSAVDLSNLFGQIGKADYNYMFPRIINGRSALSIQLTSYATAEDYAKIELAFAGALVQDFN